ncbi:receptor-like kinase TMK4 [Gastrolobium bilobum]|uniref:receptor-like kinase TMK4 n=1 Tax=Gastrolobium bilobum TaxID=150636 RepID=UPI002AB10683|nr:receptor-like kinase TMK4 [Gastrolobium bilobum]
MADSKLKSKSLVSLSKLFLCFSLLSTAAVADDSAFMSKLAKAIGPSGWSATTAFCNWSGVKCDSSNRVITINLSSKKLSGTLPPDLNSLSQLTYLSLLGNALSGSLPSLANLTMLVTVYLDGNNFTSVTDGCFQGLTNLQNISMTNNINLAPWTFPTELTQSYNLVQLDLGNTNLMGSLPDVFGSFVTLQGLRLSYNYLTGGLPKSFAGSGIQNLWLNNQRDGSGFSGSIDVLSSMTRLSQVWLHKNHFTGPIPDLSNCTSLFDLQLRDNQLTGVVPSSLMGLSSLQSISLDSNLLQGPVPVFGKGVKFTLDGINSFCQSSPGVPCDPIATTLLDVAAGFGYPLQLASVWKGNNTCQDWSFIVCAEGKIITVLLAKQNLAGTISAAFANLTDLRNLFLNDNNLVGSIPGSLTTLPQLEVLDVSNNNLSGEIPNFSAKVKKFSRAGNVLLGRPGDGGSGTSPPSDSGNAPGGSPSKTAKGSSLTPAWIAGIAIIAVFFVVVVLFVFCKCYAKNGRVNDAENGEGDVKADVISVVDSNGYDGVQSETQSQGSVERSDLHAFEGGNATISIQVLRQATNNFSEDNIVGRGGFGVVYKGELHDGTKIAVKRMESGPIGSKGMNEFQAEIAVLTKVRHRHLVALLGYCMNGNERLLVYEYMPQGTLTEHLFDWRENGCAPLTWKQRIAIALDVARGVEYLHSLAQQSFIHRDLKPSNILLADDMRAKVADFGLVKNAPDGKYSVETRLAGTFGYLAPEYAATGRVTTKVDVYAFGVVLMELITGRRALDNTLPNERSHLVSWFRGVRTNMENIPKAIDQILNPDEENMESIYKVAELAGHCTARKPYRRPDMWHAVHVLVPLVEQWKPTSHEEEEGSGIDLHMSLPRALQRWQANEGTSTMFNDMSISQTQSSIPAKPSGWRMLRYFFWQWFFFMRLLPLEVVHSICAIIPPSGQRDEDGLVWSNNFGNRNMIKLAYKRLMNFEAVVVNPLWNLIWN